MAAAQADATNDSKMTLCLLCSNLDIGSLGTSIVTPHDEPIQKCVSHHKTFEALERSAQQGCRACYCFLAAFLEFETSMGRPQSLPHDKEWNVDALREYQRGLDKDADQGMTIDLEEVRMQQGSWTSSTDGCIGLRYFRGSTAPLRKRSGLWFNQPALLRLTSPSGHHPTVVGRDIANTLSIELCSNWIRTCSAEHLVCGRIEDKMLPTRLIAVGSPADLELKLVITRGKSGRYVTLSHCWGGSRPFCTSRENYNANLDGFPLTSLPQTFQDALTTTRQLGFHYLWIDSICIIQGDREDWDAESARMGDTYRNSAVTICGPDADSADAGFLHNRKTTDSDVWACLKQSGVNDRGTDLRLGAFPCADREDWRQCFKGNRKRLWLKEPGFSRSVSYHPVCYVLEGISCILSVTPPSFTRLIGLLRWASRLSSPSGITGSHSSSREETQE